MSIIILARVDAGRVITVISMEFHTDVVSSLGKSSLPAASAQTSDTRALGQAYERPLHVHMRTTSPHSERACERVRAAVTASGYNTMRQLGRSPPAWCLHQLRRLVPAPLSVSAGP